MKMLRGLLLSVYCSCEIPTAAMRPADGQRHLMRLLHSNPRTLAKANQLA